MIAFLEEGIRVIDALIAKSDCSVDRNLEFFDAVQWKSEARRRIAVEQAEQRLAIALKIRTKSYLRIAKTK
jgi:hypothetical protein